VFVGHLLCGRSKVCALKGLIVTLIRCWLQGMGDVDEDLSWLWDDPDLEPDLFDDPLVDRAALAEHQ